MEKWNIKVTLLCHVPLLSLDRYLWNHWIKNKLYMFVYICDGGSENVLEQKIHKDIELHDLNIGVYLFCRIHNYKRQ